MEEAERADQIRKSTSTSSSNRLSLSVLTAIFPGGPGLAGTRMSPFWISLELRMYIMVVTTGAIRRAKLQSNRHHQQTNTQLFTGRMPFLSPGQQCQSTEGKTKRQPKIIPMYQQELVHTYERPQFQCSS